MDIKKNEIFNVHIEDMSTDGEGIGKIAGYTLFIKDAIIGDYVSAKVLKANKNYGFAKVEEIINPSPDRVKAICDVARTCGGCVLQNMSYEKQLEYKGKKVKDCLERIGGFKDIKVENVIGMEEPYYYRNKAQFVVGNKNGKIVTGFYAGRTHSIIENSGCVINAKVNDEILQVVKKYMNENKIKPYNELNHSGIVRHIFTRVGFKTGEIMVCLVINGKEADLKNVDKLIESLTKIEGMRSICVNINTEKTNKIMGNQTKVLWGQKYIFDYIGNVKFKISPDSFYQINPIQTEKLYGKALEYAELTGNETVWDMYCGIGTISLLLSQEAKSVKGVEIVKQAIDDAKENAEINNIENAEFYVGKAEEVITAWSKNKEKADVIVVDPPRKGCELSLLNAIGKVKPRRIVYVSCDPATLARDLKILYEQKYVIEKVQPVDMFPQTKHTETVVRLVR